MQPIELEPALRKLYGLAPCDIELTKLKGDASTRSYYRLRVAGVKADGSAYQPGSLIVMYLPEDSLRSDEAVTGQAPRELPFINLQRLLVGRGVPVPEIYLDDSAHRVVLLEDLGDETLEARLNNNDRASRPAMYRQAVRLLVRLHKACNRPEPGCVAYERKFDADLLRWELDHFRQWGLESWYGPLNSADGSEFDASFRRIVGGLENVTSGFVHRDFQSRNLMFAPRKTGEVLVVIDFQDALIGPRPYDLVALLCDSYVDLDLALQEEMIAYYVSLRGLSGPEAERFERDFWLTAVHRKLKDAGRFVFIDRVRGNPGFLRWYPQSLCYVGRALEKLDGFRSLDGLLKRLIPGFPDQVPEPVAVNRR
jgi:N-acetylmuramate 1-kinase